jgi:hypothetical protein
MKEKLKAGLKSGYERAKVGYGKVAEFSERAAEKTYQASAATAKTLGHNIKETAKHEYAEYKERREIEQERKKEIREAEREGLKEGRISAARQRGFERAAERKKPMQPRIQVRRPQPISIFTGLPIVKQPLKKQPKVQSFSSSAYILGMPKRSLPKTHRSQGSIVAGHIFSGIAKARSGKKGSINLAGQILGQRQTTKRRRVRR